MFRHTRVRETPIRAESLRVLVVGLRCTVSRMFSCSSMFCLRARSDETWALGSVPQSRNVLNTLKTLCDPEFCALETVDGILQQQQWHYHRGSHKLTSYPHISHLWRCAAFPQHSNNVTINSHNSQLTLHTDSHASDSGAAWREGKTILGAQAKPLQYTVKCVYLGNRSEWSMTCWLVPLF